MPRLRRFPLKDRRCGRAGKMRRVPTDQCRITGRHQLQSGADYSTVRCTSQITPAATTIAESAGTP